MTMPHLARRLRLCNDVREDATAAPHARSTKPMAADVAEALRLAKAAPSLQALHADIIVRCPEEAAQLASPALGAVRLRQLALACPEWSLLGLLPPGAAPPDRWAPSALLAAAAPASEAQTLSGLLLHHAPLAVVGEMTALADAALERRLSMLCLSGHCLLDSGAAAQLARVVAGGFLRDLDVNAVDTPLLAPGPSSAGALARAAGASVALTSLALRSAALWEHPVATAQLLRALAGHVTLRRLVLQDAFPGEPDGAAAFADVAAALARLVAARGALRDLDVSGTRGWQSRPPDAALAPLCAALGGAGVRLRALSLQRQVLSRAAAGGPPGAGGARQHVAAGAAPGRHSAPARARRARRRCGRGGAG